jgi:hypothetical protein
MTTQTKTLDDAIATATAIVRQAVPAVGWRELNNIDPLLPDDIVDAYTILAPFPEPFLRVGRRGGDRRSPRGTLVNVAVQWLLFLDDDLEVRRWNSRWYVRRRPLPQAKRAALKAIKREVNRAYNLVVKAFIDCDEAPVMRPTEMLARAGVNEQARLLAVRRVLLLLESADDMRSERILGLVTSLGIDAVEPVNTYLFMPRYKVAYPRKFRELLEAVTAVDDVEARRFFLEWMQGFDADMQDSVELRLASYDPRIRVIESRTAPVCHEQR